MATGLPPNLTDQNNEWVLDFSNFRTAWLRSRGEGITIAHPDTGFTDHPELVAPGYRRDLSVNFYDPVRYSRVCTPDRAPSLRDLPTGWLATAHGTGTGGVLVSPEGHPNGDKPGASARFPEGDSRAFVSGAAPGAAVIPFRVSDNVLLFDNEDAALVQCIYYCIALRLASIDVAVMSISLGGIRLGTEKKVKTALAAARLAGIVVIAAAGQLEGHDRHIFGVDMPADIGSPKFPGSSPDVICAAGCDSRHGRLRMAFYGSEVDISAPAVDVWMSRTKWRGVVESYRVEQSSGTSYAAALTAAACAIWQSHHDRQRLIDIYGRHRLHTLFKHCLQQSADRPPGWEADRGAGVLDVEKLLDFPLPSVADVDRLPR